LKKRDQEKGIKKDRDRQVLEKGELQTRRVSMNGKRGRQSS